MSVGGFGSDSTDVSVENHSSIILLRPHTDAAREWFESNVESGAFWFGGAMACEPRYVDDIIDGMLADGLEVSS